MRNQCNKPPTTHPLKANNDQDFPPFASYIPSFFALLNILKQGQYLMSFHASFLQAFCCTEEVNTACGHYTKKDWLTKSTLGWPLGT